MGQALYGKHRSQTDAGAFAAGRNLFPTLPEDKFDHGPLVRSRFVLVADVRLDNRPELLAGLGLASSQQSGLSDAAVLFESLLKWREGTLDRLVGEFAFALWDGAKQDLLLGRDILGLRPLGFHQGRDFFAFASMPSGLHALDDVPYDFDAEFLAERLALLPRMGRSTCFRGIERVEPGHVLRVTRDGIQSHRFWKPPPRTPSRQAAKDYAEGLRFVVDQAVTAQLRGAGETIATHLSGGLDSSTVTATIARIVPDARILAYTAVPRPGFEGRTPPGTIGNEAQLAAATARMYANIEHSLVVSSGESPLTWLDRNFLYQQQPMSILQNAAWGQAIHAAAQAAGSTTIFKGALGNLTMSYSGLEWLPALLSGGRLLKLAHHARSLARNGMPLPSIGARVFGPFIPAPVWTAVRRRLGKTAGLRDYSAANLALLREQRDTASDRLALRPHRDPYRTRLEAFTQIDGGNAYKGVLGEWGLSVRDPTGDKRVVEYCLSVPFEEYIRGGIPRSLARRAFSDRLPAAVTSARIRGYQSADWYEAMDQARSEIQQEVDAIARCAGAREALDVTWLEEALTSWPSGEWGSSEVLARYRFGLLGGISAGHFMRKVRGTN